MADSYHHGNLRQALIDAGVKIINENGEENLSLRKVAAACGVSHAAPYAHFKDKDELIEAIKENVTERFMEKLVDAIEGKPTADAAIIAMGRAYVTFFSKNPDYYIFLFGKQNITAHLKMNKEYKGDYPPFLLLRRMYLLHLEQNGLEKTVEEQEIELIKIWSIVHGMASIACMKGVKSSFNWNDFLSVNWSSGHFPDRLVIAMRNYKAVYSAWDGDKLVGLIAAMDDGIMNAYVHYLLVDPEYQGLAIGKNLVERVKDYYKDYMRICVIAYDTAIEFYKHCGFEVSEGASPMCITTLWT